MKKYFFAGFLALLPLALTIIVTVWLFNLLTNPLAGMMESLIVNYQEHLPIKPEEHHTLVLFLSRLSALIFIIVLVFLLGIFGERFILKPLLKVLNKLLEKIPFVRRIFRISNDVTKAVLSSTKKTFQETVLLPFPHKDAHTIGFVTGEVPAFIEDKAKGAQLTVFVPTAPHPISGFMILISRDQVKHVDMTVEEAFKFLISCGTLYPEEQRKGPSQSS